MAFRVRNVLGTFEKRAPSQSFSPSLCGPNSYTRVDNWVKLHSSVRPWLPVVKVRPAYSVKLVFSFVVKGIKIKITAKFRASRRFRFEDTKRIMSPEIRPKSFGTFEKQAPG